jgi:hypothetical protein
MKPFPFCLLPSKFGGGDGFKSNFGCAAEARLAGRRLTVSGSEPPTARVWCLVRQALGYFWPLDWPISLLVSDFRSGRGPYFQKVMRQVKRGILAG